MTAYPKLLLLLTTFVLAFFLLYLGAFEWFRSILTSLGYLGTFLLGMFFVYGFTAAPATALLIVSVEEQPFFTTWILASLGAMAGDLIVFRAIRHHFQDEIDRFTQTAFFLRLLQVFGRTPQGFQKYFLLVVSGLLIASPLPDEIGISILAAARNVSIRTFAALALALNALGLLVILGGASLVLGM